MANIGHCYCQKIQFEAAPPFLMCSHCHCESCRRTHGAAFVTWTAVLNENFRIKKGQDKIKSFESSPGIHWMFCKDCGSPLFQKTKHSPEKTYISVVHFEEEIPVLPDSHVSFEEKVSWFHPHDDLPKHQEKSSDLI